MLVRIIAFFLLTLAGNAAREARFLKRTPEANGEYRNVVPVPGDWTTDKSSPGILFLHGSEERGSDGLAQSTVV